MNWNQNSTIPGDLFHVALGLSADLGKTFVKLIPELDTGVLGSERDE
jgi:hypothetical protein